jgi:diguanylate cyclase (GGDEF)-like protein
MRMPRSTRTERTARAGLVLLLGIFVLGALLRRNHPGQVPLLDLWVFNAVYLVSVLLCLRYRSNRPGSVWAWRCVAAALLTTVLGNIYYTLITARMVDPPDFGVGDAFYLAAYPLSYIAVVLALRARVRRFLSSMWCDGVVTGLGVTAVVTAIPLGGLLTVTGTSTDKILADVAYPVADLLLLALLAAVAAVLGVHSDRTLVTAGAGLAVISGADVVYLVQSAAGTYAEGGLADSVQLLGVVLVAFGAGVRKQRGDAPAAETAAGVRPAIDPVAAGRMTGQIGHEDARVGWQVLALPAMATVSSVTLLAVSADGFPGGLARYLAGGSVLAALVRMFLTLREIRNLGDVHRQARTDDLTGLLNRRAFYEQCEQVVRTVAVHSPAALLILDLDRFKEINDSLGHAAGDELLVQVADRLRRHVRADDVLARLGGDEFAVLLPRTAERAALSLAAELGQALGDTFSLDTMSVHIETSIGVACAPVAATTRRELVRCADVAMYQAKTHRSGLVSYTAVDAEDSVERLRIIDELRRVIGLDARAGRLVVHLQPQILLASRGAASAAGVAGVAGVEALVRWDHPVRGLLRPASFLPAAQAAGLMGAVTDAVLDLSLAACRQWWDCGYQVPVSVNVSAANVHDQTLPAKVATALGRHGLPAPALVVELTEDTLMTDPGRARRVLEQLRLLGVKVSIDDYGTGYSSLAYLRNLPVDELKMDRAFTGGLVDDPAAAAIVRHTAQLAHALGLRLVAEGVEDCTTLEVIDRLGCDIAQGYHIARPMPADEMLAWLHRQTAPRPRAPLGSST